MWERLRQLFRIECRDSHISISSNCCKKQKITIKIHDLDPEMVDYVRQTGDLLVHLKGGKVESVEKN
jgi:hypothetical protein